MTDQQALIRQSDARHVQDTGKPAFELASGNKVAALKMQCDFEFLSDDGRTLTGSFGDSVIYNTVTGKLSMVREPMFSMLYKVAL